jgi:hypothetical protein
VDFAHELEIQLEALRRPVDRLSVLSGQALALGEFDEAHSLRQRHVLAATQMHDLVSRVHDVVGFADDVTHSIADGYARSDQQIAGMFQGGNQPTTSPTGTAPAGTAPDPAGTVYRSASALGPLSADAGAAALPAGG